MFQSAELVAVSNILRSLSAYLQKNLHTTEGI